MSGSRASLLLLAALTLGPWAPGADQRPDTASLPSISTRVSGLTRSAGFVPFYVEPRTFWGCTMYFRNNEWSRSMMKEWDAQCKATPQFSADSNFRYLLMKRGLDREDNAPLCNLVGRGLQAMGGAADAFASSEGNLNDLLGS